MSWEKVASDLKLGGVFPFHFVPHLELFCPHVTTDCLQSLTSLNVWIRLAASHVIEVANDLRLGGGFPFPFCPKSACSFSPLSIFEFSLQFVIWGGGLTYLRLDGGFPFPFCHNLPPSPLSLSVSWVQISRSCSLRPWGRRCREALFVIVQLRLDDGSIPLCSRPACWLVGRRAGGLALQGEIAGWAREHPSPRPSNSFFTSSTFKLKSVPTQNWVNSGILVRQPYYGLDSCSSIMIEGFHQWHISQAAFDSCLSIMI